MKNYQLKIFNRKTLMTAIVVASFATVISLANLSWAAPALSVNTSNGAILVSSDLGADVYVRISGPNGYFKELKGTSLTEWSPGPDAPDGSYRYDSYSSVKVPQGTMSKSDWDRAIQQNATQTHGGFKIENGVLIPTPVIRTAPSQSRNDSGNLLLNAVTSMLDILIPTANAENLILSSTQPTITFNDEDAPLMFPATPIIFQIVGNSATTTTNDFVLFDITNGTTILTLRSEGANADDSLVVGIGGPGDIGLASNTVYIDKSAKNVGIGTTTPTTDLHILGSGDVELSMQSTLLPSAPRWELEADDISIGINENDSELKFTVFKDAQDATLVVGSFAGPSGNVGIGTITPTAKLDVQGDIKATFDGSSGGGLQQLFRMSANNTNAANRSDVGFVMENAREGFSWAFRTEEEDQGFTASKQGTGDREFTLKNTTNDVMNVELILGNGAKNVNGVWLNASSRSYKKNIHDLSGGDAMQALRGLKSVTYQYKQDIDNEQMVGFIAEDVPELIATNDRKTLDPMKIVAVLTKAVQEQDESLQALKTEVESKNQRIAEMEMKLSDFELLKQRLNKIEASIKLP